MTRSSTERDCRRRSVGCRSCYTERRVGGPSPYGGEWDHGWRRESAQAAEAHAREMVAQPDVPWARVQTRTVETEIVGEMIIGDRQGLAA